MINVIFLHLYQQAAAIALKFLTQDKSMQVVQHIAPKLMEIKQYTPVRICVYTDSILLYVYVYILINILIKITQLSHMYRLSHGWQCDMIFINE